MSNPSAATIRYRARVAERAFIREEIRKHWRLIDQLAGEFDGDTALRLKRYSRAAERILGLIHDLPEPKRPAARKRKAKVLRIVRSA